MGGCVSVQLSCDQALSQVCGCFFNDGNYISMMKANLETLENTMQQLKEMRNDLSRRVSLEEDKGLQRLDQVQGWISRVQGVEFEVSELLKAKSTETQRLCLFGYCSKKCKSSFKYGKKVSKKLKDVQDLLSKGAFDVLAEKALIPKVGKKPIETTIGLDSMVEKAWNSITDPKVTTLGLHGMGGVGKTTLLGRINNKFIEKVNEFDVVIWVVVSKDLQIEGIQNQILGRLSHDKEWKNETEEEKASSIYNILSRKKYVLLLDDIWSEVDLNQIGVPPPTPDNGSKIVFTTRSKDVCKDMGAGYELKVDCLSPEEAWELFGNIVGENILKCHEEIKTLAEDIVDKCCGLPLALTVIGKTMKGKEDVHEWRHTLNLLNSSSQKYSVMKDKILPILKVSYDGLKDKDVKSCFLYCSLFPEDYEIEKEELIEYWICEGFINGNREEDGSSSQGHVIINSLVRAHLLMAVGEKVKMHDVIREMALWIASDSLQSDEELHFVKCGGQLRNIPDDIEWEVVKRISLMSNQIAEISCCPNCPNLLTLLLCDNSLKDISGVMEELKLLKHLEILTATIEDDLILERIQGVKRLANCVRVLGVENMSAAVVVLNTTALSGLQHLHIINCKISEIKIDWEISKEREELLCKSSFGFKHLSGVYIGNLEGPKDLTWLFFAQNLRILSVEDSGSIEEIIDREKEMRIRNMHPYIDAPFAKLQFLCLEDLPELRRICSIPLAMPDLEDFYVRNCPNMPESATEFLMKKGPHCHVGNIEV